MADVIWENIKVFLTAVVLALIIKTSVVEAYKVPTGSMEDTILIGDFLIANKFVYGAKIPLTGWRLPAISDPKPGDVVVFTYPGDRVTSYVKRLVAVEGQKIEIKNKILYVDGMIVPDAPEAKHTDSRVYPRGNNAMGSRDNWGPYTVPKDCYFMMGDNRDLSYDSRFWGSVHKDLILGKAMIIHWSWSEDNNSPEVTATDPLTVPRSFVYNTLHFFDRVRWGRLLTVFN
ncbi:MAG: signal peptidase I [candidate division Zixibacteria bacterium]|nr:signal peptidase I [candidate division Zixibacteria bacterium]